MDIVDELKGIANLSLTTTSYNNREEALERLAVYRSAIEIEKLRKMVKDAYNTGFFEGMKEYTSSRGGIPWSDCKFRKEIE